MTGDIDAQQLGADGGMDRVTVRLPDDLIERTDHLAAAQGHECRSVVIREALRNHLDRGGQPAAPAPEDR